VFVLVHIPLHVVGVAVGQPTHTLPVHVWPGKHACPHEAQLLKSLRGSVQTPPQFKYGNVQMHVPPLHVCIAAHMWPHVPQLLMSLSTLTHAVPDPHIIVPGGQVHVPPTHTCPGPHTLPQAPQLFTSVFVLEQTPPHTARPGPVQTQAPAEQTSAALQQFVPHERWGGAHRHVLPTHVCPDPHALPHAPQLSASLVRFAQKALVEASPPSVPPSATVGMHVVSGNVHVIWQAP
jgi:hypothetical protein